MQNKTYLKQILFEPFKALQNKTFAKLYLAQTISLLGDAFSWVGLALLAYQIDKERSPIILATALTLRVTAFILFSPFAGVFADGHARDSSCGLARITVFTIQNQSWLLARSCRTCHVLYLLCCCNGKGANC